MHYHQLAMDYQQQYFSTLSGANKIYNVYATGTPKYCWASDTCTNTIKSIKYRAYDFDSTCSYIKWNSLQVYTPTCSSDIAVEFDLSTDQTDDDYMGTYVSLTTPTPQILIPKDSHRAKEAAERARVLLKSLLTSDQWREYEANGTITITSQSGARYRLSAGSRVRNVTRLGKDDLPIEVLCCHPMDDLPMADVLIAQKIHLECAEAVFRKTANISAVEPQHRATAPNVIRGRSLWGRLGVQVDADTPLISEEAAVAS